MYKDSYVTMSNKNSAIFLATILVAGIIGMSSTLIASAEEYGYEKEKKYDSYDSYPPEMKYDKKGHGKAYQSAKCDNTNVNINIAGQFQAQQQSEPNDLVNSAATTELNGQPVEPNQLLQGLNNNGQSLLNLERNIVNFCVNENYNDQEISLFQQQQQQQQQNTPLN